MTSLTAHFRSRLAGQVGALMAALVLGLCPHAAMGALATFDTPQAAMTALLDALEKRDSDAVLALFGKENRDFIIGGDPASARKGFGELAAAAKQATVFRPDGENRRIIEVGRLAYPLPVPLVRENGKWHFDTEAGKEEITNRRIGRNELNAIRLAHDYVNAQLEYASKDRDGDDVLEYAEKFAAAP